LSSIFKSSSASQVIFHQPDYGPQNILIKAFPQGIWKMLNHCINWLNNNCGSVGKSLWQESAQKCISLHKTMRFYTKVDKSTQNYTCLRWQIKFSLYVCLSVCMNHWLFSVVLHERWESERAPLKNTITTPITSEAWL